MNSNKHSKMTALALALTIILSLFNNFTVFAENGLNDETVTENPVIEEPIEETETNEGVEEVEEPTEEEKPEEVVEKEELLEVEVPAVKIEEQQGLFSDDRSPENYSIKYRYDWPNYWMFNNIVPRARFKDGYTAMIKAEKTNLSNDNIVVYSDITTFEGNVVDGSQIYIKSANIPLMNNSDEVEIFARKTKTSSWENISSKLSGTNISLTKEDGYGALKIVYKNISTAGEVEIKINYIPTDQFVADVKARPMNAHPADITSYIGLSVQDANTSNWAWEYNSGDYLIKKYPKTDKTTQIGATQSSFQGVYTDKYRTVEESGKEIEVLRGAGYQDDWTQNNASNLRVLDWLSVKNEPGNSVNWNNSPERYNIKHNGPIYMPGGRQNLPIKNATYVLFLPKNIFLDENYSNNDLAMWSESTGDLKPSDIKTEIVDIKGVDRQKVTITIDFAGKEWLASNAVWRDIPLYTTDFNTYKCGSTFSYETRLIINGIYNVNGDDLDYSQLDRDHINNTGHWYRDELGNGNTPDESKLVDNGVNDWVYAANASGTIPCISLTYDPNPVEGQTVSGTTPVDTKKYSYALNDDKGNVIRDKATVLEKGDMVSSGGYQFAGWNTEADGTGIKYLPGAEADIAENTTLYAMWANTVDVVVTKTWADENNRDGIRPENVTVQLMKGIEAEGAAVVLDKDNSWSHTWENLLKFDNDGNEFVYTVTETAIDNYEPMIVHTTAEEGTKSKITATITNTHEPEKITISGTKTWDDKNDQDGKRPTSIEVKLLADGTELATKSVTKADNWKYEFKDVYKYKENAVGVEIKYTTEEVAVDDYVFSHTDSDKINITNKYSPEETSRTVVKTWTDENDKDKIRPASIKIQLYKDGVALGTPAVVKSSEKWSYTWTGLDKYRDGGIEVIYTIKEVDVPNGYTPRYSEDKATNSFKVNNLHEVKNEVDYSPIIWDWGHTTPTIDGTKLHRAYINGYPDGSVKPQGEITRGEVAAIMSRLHADVEEIEYSTETKYADVKATDWYAKHIAYVSDKGLMEGYEDGSFKPEDKITRAEYATVVARFKNLERIATSFEDSKDHWASEFIGAVANKKWITGYPDGSFKPMNNISREEVATMTNKMLDRNVDEVGVGNLNIKKFTDLLHGTWSYYEMVEASNTHEYVRRGTNSIVEDWKNVK